MQILLATTNPHKLDEIRQVIPAASVSLHTLGDVPGGERLAEPHEDQPTFEGNAVLKARYYARETGQLTLADDSGLEVDALDGAPGVRSARYSGATGARREVDMANNRKLLLEMEPVAVERRAARFVCAMALCAADAEQPLAVVRGTVEGRIILREEAADPGLAERGRGDNGFGYDPLFFLIDRGCTTAQLTPEQKNAISHRGDAARKMWRKLIELGLAEDPAHPSSAAAPGR